MKLPLLVPVFVLALGTSAPATVLTFDNLPETVAPIPQGYGGLNWYGIEAGNFGGFPAFVSPPNFAAVEGPDTGFGRNTPFTVRSAYFTSGFFLSLPLRSSVTSETPRSLAKRLMRGPLQPWT